MYFKMGGGSVGFAFPLLLTSLSVSDSAISLDESFEAASLLICDPSRFLSILHRMRYNLNCSQKRTYLSFLPTLSFLLMGDTCELV